MARRDKMSPPGILADSFVAARHPTCGPAAGRPSEPRPSAVFFVIFVIFVIFV